MHLQNNRIFGLDVLRAFAILFVIYDHGIHYIDLSIIPTEIYNIPIFDGVTMFFVLSGFLIGRILLRMLAEDHMGAKSLMEFWVRRWLRTLPNYFLVLTFLAAVNYLYGRPQPDSLIQYYFFSQNIAAPHPGFFPEAWSLSIEEWFYLVIPILMYLSSKLLIIERGKVIPFWIALIIVSVTAFRVYRAYRYGYSTYDDWDAGLRKQVVTRFDSLMLGVLGSYISIYYSVFWDKVANKAFIAGISLILFDHLFYVAVPSGFYIKYFTLTVSTVGTLLLLPKLSTMKCNNGWIVSIITFISLISYSMYLLGFSPVQGVILPVIMRYLTDLYPSFSQHIYLVKYSMYWIITLALSFLLYQYFERPMTALRERFHTPRRSAVTAFADSEARMKP